MDIIRKEFGKPSSIRHIVSLDGDGCRVGLQVGYYGKVQVHRFAAVESITQIPAGGQISVLVETEEELRKFLTDPHENPVIPVACEALISAAIPVLHEKLKKSQAFYRAEQARRAKRDAMLGK